MSSTLSRVLLVASLLMALVIPVLPSSAATQIEVHLVPTDAQGGAVLRVEVRRETAFDAQGQGVLLSLSPYNSLSEPGIGVLNPGAGYTALGIASASADVLGTRGSTGCWDYGGIDEQQAGVDVVRFLAGDIPDVDGNYLDWSNGRVGMTGVSYDGTTANMVAGAAPELWGGSYDAATGETPLKAIVPIAAISHWYGYAFQDGVRFFLNSESATDEGFDTPLAFDHGFGDTVHTDSPDTITARAAECDAIEHEMQAYSRNPDYTEFWEERDYTNGAPTWSADTLIVHGWNDYNVKQYEATYLYEALAPYADDPTTAEVEGFDLRMWMTQSTHANGNGRGYAEMLANFFAANLLEGDVAAQAAVDLEAVPHVRSLGESTSGRMAETNDGPLVESGAHFSQTWPPATTTSHRLFLNRTYEQDVPGVTIPGPGTGEVGELSYTNAFAGPLEGRAGSYGASSSWVDIGLATEEVSRRDPWSNDGQKLGTVGGQGYYSLAFSTGVLTRDVRIAGSAVLDGYFSQLAPTAGSHLTPVLVDIAPDGSYKTIQRGFLNVDYRDGRESTAPAPSGMFAAQVEFLPEDYTVPAGNRIGMILQSSNTVWAVPGNPAGLATVHLGGTTADGAAFDGTVLELPLVDVTADEQVFTDYAHPAL